MMSNKFRRLIAAITAVVALTLVSQMVGLGQDGAPKGGGKKGGGAPGGPPGGATLPGGLPGGIYGPYFSPAVIKGGPIPRTPDGKPDLSGYWFGRFGNTVFNIEDNGRQKGSIVDPPGGKIPYKPEARAKQVDLKQNHMFDEPEAHCYMSGVPHAVYQHFGFQVTMHAKFMLWQAEYAHSYRTISTDGRPHAAPKDAKLFMGESVGHWEGDTLVVDTTNLNGLTWFDMEGNFTTPNMHVVERYTMTDSENVTVEATITNPDIYTQPWKIQGTWGRNPDKAYEQMEFGCVEGNQDLEHYIKEEGGDKSKKR
jgi:hypothetical protein